MIWNGGSNICCGTTTTSHENSSGWCWCDGVKYWASLFHAQCNWLTMDAKLISRHVESINYSSLSTHEKQPRLCICMDESWCIEKLLKLGISTIKRTMPLATWHGVNSKHSSFLLESANERAREIYFGKERIMRNFSLGIITPWLLVKLFNYFFIKTKANFWSLKVL